MRPWSIDPVILLFASVFFALLCNRFRLSVFSALELCLTPERDNVRNVFPEAFFVLLSIFTKRTSPVVPCRGVILFHIKLCLFLTHTKKGPPLRSHGAHSPPLYLTGHIVRQVDSAPPPRGQHVLQHVWAIGTFLRLRGHDPI